MSARGLVAVTLAPAIACALVASCSGYGEDSDVNAPERALDGAVEAATADAITEAASDASADGANVNCTIVESSFDSLPSFMVPNLFNGTLDVENGELVARPDGGTVTIAAGEITLDGPYRTLDCAFYASLSNTTGKGSVLTYDVLGQSRVSTFTVALGWSGSATQAELLVREADGGTTQTDLLGGAPPSGRFLVHAALVLGNPTTVALQLANVSLVPPTLPAVAPGMSLQVRVGIAQAGGSTAEVHVDDLRCTACP